MLRSVSGFAMRALIGAAIVFSATSSRAQVLGPSHPVPREQTGVDRMLGDMQTANEILLQLHAIPASVVHDRIDAAFDSIKRGKQINMMFVTNEDTTQPMRFRLTVDVLLQYEPRPIGGILRIASNLVPMFTGIYAASRPDASADFAQAVDYIDVDELTCLVAGHIQQLGEQYAVRNAHKRLQWYDPAMVREVSAAKPHER